MKEISKSAASCNRNVRLHIQYFCPESGDIKGVIQVVHGMTEYIERYQEFAEYFTERGYVVAGNDIISHGKSKHRECNSLYFDNWFDAVEDIVSVTKQIKRDFEGKPVFLLGFSLGSYLVRSLPITGLYDRKIIVGTGSQPGVLLAGIKLLVKQKCPDRKQPSKFIRRLAFDNYDTEYKNRPSGTWLLRDKEKRQEYWSDKRIVNTFTSGFFIEFLSGMQAVNRQEKIEKNVPVLFISGSEDPVGGNGKGVSKVYRKYQKQCNNVSFEKIRNYGHDILHDGCRQGVYDRIYKFIRSDLPVEIR